MRSCQLAFMYLSHPYREQARSYRGLRQFLIRTKPGRLLLRVATELAPLLLIPHYPPSECQKIAGRQRE